MKTVKMPLNYKDCYFLKDDENGRKMYNRFAELVPLKEGQIILLTEDEFKGLQDMIIIKS